jgi:hypothetical protein
MWLRCPTDTIQVPKKCFAEVPHLFLVKADLCRPRKREVFPHRPPASREARLGKTTVFVLLLPIGHCVAPCPICHVRPLPNVPSCPIKYALMYAMPQIKNRFELPTSNGICGGINAYHAWGSVRSFESWTGQRWRCVTIVFSGMDFGVQCLTTVNQCPYFLKTQTYWGRVSPMRSTMCVCGL